MARPLHLAILAIVTLPIPTPACPVCDRETGREVRAGIFDEDFAANLVAAAAPFGVFLGLTAAILRVGKSPRRPGRDHA